MTDVEGLDYQELLDVLAGSELTGMAYADLLNYLRKDLLLDPSTDLLPFNPPTWTRLTSYYGTNWTDYDLTGIWQPGRFTKDIFGWVTVEGLVKSVGAYVYGAASALVCGLPVGYRPQQDYMFTCVGSDGGGNQFVGRVGVYVSGGISIDQGVGTNNLTSGFQTLSGIRFPTN